MNTPASLRSEPEIFKDWRQKRLFTTNSSNYQRKMNGPSWRMFAVVLCFYGTCLDGTDCMSLKSNEQKLDCIRHRSSARDLTATLTSPERQNDEAEEGDEEQLTLDLLLSALSPDSSEARDPADPLRSEERRSYSMEHFRWGKPMGLKRRPVKVFPGIALEVEPEGSTERMRVQRGQDADPRQTNNNARSNGKYRMTHFRWNGPPDNRYGGFTRPRAEQSHKPLFTLLRHDDVSK